jgi:hypothetical protein
MILRQTLHTSPAIASSYVFGCGSRSIGAVVDPVANPQFYLDVAATLGMHASTIGFERRYNKAFSIDDRQTFVDAMVRDIPLPPLNAAENRSINLGREVALESLVAAL